MVVNLSSRNLHDVELVGHIAGLIEQWQVSPSHYNWKSPKVPSYKTQHGLWGHSQNYTTWGTMLLIDYFGTGYSSPSYLKQLPVQEIKADQHIHPCHCATLI